MRRWLESGRVAWVIGGVFVLAGLLYWFLNRGGIGIDPGGATLLVLLGGAMTFGIVVLLRGSRDL